MLIHWARPAFIQPTFFKNPSVKHVQLAPLIAQQLWYYTNSLSPTRAPNTIITNAFRRQCWGIIKAIKKLNKITN